MFIREFHITDQQSKTVDDLREAIESVRDDLRAGKLDLAKRTFDRIVIFGKYKA